MLTKDLIEYLSEFDPEDAVGLIALDTETRQAYSNGDFVLITDAGFPVLMVELGESAPMDDDVEVEEDIG